MSRRQHGGTPSSPGPTPWQDLVTTEFIEKMAAKVRPDPVTGKVEYANIDRFIRENADDPDVGKILSRAVDMMAQHEQIDVSSYNFASLTPEEGTVWQFTIQDRGRSGRVNKRFAFACIGMKGEPRHIVDFHEMPEPSMVLKFLRDAIANRPFPLTPTLPEFMIFAPKYEPYVPILAPFLDSLPLKWSLETPPLQAARSAVEGIHDEFRGATYMDLAEQCKSAGKFAYSKKNRAGAIDAFSSAIDHAKGALQEVGDPRQQVAARRMLAVCLANRAGAHLMAGPDMSAKEALSDAEKAEAADPTYVKAYHRQARAHEHLGQVGKAREVTARAMQNLGLGDEQSLKEQMCRLEAL